MEELKKPQRSVSSTKNQGLGMRGSPVFGELLKIYGKFLHADTLSNIWPKIHLSTCALCGLLSFPLCDPLLHCLLLCVSPYRIFYCRNLPLSISLSTLTVFFVYMLVNVSYFTLLTKDEFLSSWAVGVVRN